MDRRSTYARAWDQYIANLHLTEPQRSRAPGYWPGDEWGSPEEWRNLFRNLFEKSGEVATWRRVVEIGAGSGKYTAMTLDAAPCAIRAYDVSAAFLDVLRRRLAAAVTERRLVPVLMTSERADEILDDLDSVGWRRRVDGFFSIDAMVHVDLQHLVAYFMTAALALRPGGRMIMTLGNAGTKAGIDHLFSHIPLFHRDQGRPGGKFERLSIPLLHALLPRLGFAVDFIDAGRDIWLCARLAAPDVADGLARHLRP